MGFSPVQPAFIFKNRSPNSPHVFLAGPGPGSPVLPGGRDLSGTTSTSTSLRSFRKTFTASNESSACTAIFAFFRPCRRERGFRRKWVQPAHPFQRTARFLNRPGRFFNGRRPVVNRLRRRRKRRQLLGFGCNDGDWCFDRRSGGFFRRGCPSGLVRRRKWIFRRTKFRQINLFVGAIRTFSPATERQTFSGSQQCSKFHNYSISLKASGANAASAA